MKKIKIMFDKIKKWWNRKWSNWEVYDEKTSEYWGYNKRRIVTTLKRTSNDGLIEYKVVKN